MARKTKKTSAFKATAKDYSIILSPIITEKTSVIGNGGNTVVFKVQRGASKEEIKRAVERVFDKQVVAVRTSNILGKPKKKTQKMGRTAAYKKAYVTLAEGQTIELLPAA